MRSQCVRRAKQLLRASSFDRWLLISSIIYSNLSNLRFAHERKLRRKMTVSPAPTISWNSAASGTNQIDDDFVFFCYWNFPFHLPKYINTFGWKPLIRHTQRIFSTSGITCTKTNDCTLYSIVISATISRVISSQFRLLHILKTYFGFFPVNLFDSYAFCL